MRGPGRVRFVRAAGRRAGEPAVRRRAVAGGRRWVSGALGAVCFAGLLLTAACQRPPRGEPGPSAAEDLAERLAGCWELVAGAEGSVADTVRRWREEGALPRAVEFDTARAETAAGGDGYRVAWSHVSGRRQRRPLAAWRAVSGDSVRVETPGALAGTVLRLAVEPDGLAGVATVFTDVVEPGRDGGSRTAPVEGRPTDCPAPDVGDSGRPAPDAGAG